MRRFLRFIVEQKLSGEAEKIKEYVVAVEVFDKDASFDPRVDPIVRVEAGRLRSKLREYYETEGGADPIKIALPKGGYVPGFQTCTAQAVLGEASQGSPPSQTVSQNSIQSRNGFSLLGNGAVADPESDLPHLEQNPIVSIRSRETDEARQKYRPAWIAATLAVLLLMAGIAYWINKQPAIDTSDRPLIGPFTTYLGSEWDPSYSRDGKRIYFQSNRDQSGQVWRMPAEGGEATQLTRKGGHAPQESMDGKLLFYWKGTDTHFGELWKLPAEGGAEIQVVGGVLRANFDVKQQGIYYVAQPDGKGTQFLYYDFATAKTKHISTTEHAVFWGFTVSPDEKSILSTQMGARGGSDLVLVENFQ